MVEVGFGLCFVLLISPYLCHKLSLSWSLRHGLPMPGREPAGNTLPKTSGELDLGGSCSFWGGIFWSSTGLKSLAEGMLGGYYFPRALEEFCWPAVRGSKDCKISSVQWEERGQDSGSEENP